MLKITLGEMLKSFRVEKGIDAKQVCAGLCSTAMMSYFEKGEKVPDTLLFEYMMERMGVSPELFSVMVSKEEYEYYEWKEQVTEAIAERDDAKLEKLLASKIAKKKYCNSKLERQFLLYATAIHYGINEKYDEAAMMLEEAAKITIPDANIIRNAEVLLSAMELHVLMLYLYYGVLGGVLEVDKGKKLFHILEAYIDSERLELSLRAKTYTKLCCIGMQLFDKDITDDEQIILCEKSVELLVQDLSFYEITNVLRIYILLLEKKNSSKLNFYKKQYEVFEDILRMENVDTEFYAESFVVNNPKFYIINEYLLSKRREKELTQEQLSEGICEPETYSRVEVGKRAPSRKNFQRLAERLDINWCYYRGELDSANLKAFELRVMQREANINGRRQECLDILEELEKQVDMTSVVNVQYIRSNQYVAEYRLEKLSAAETYIKLKELLELTQKEENVSSQLVYYSQTELEIVAHMAQILRSMKQYKRGIELILTVIRQMQNGKIDMKYQWNGFGFLLRVLSGLFFRSKDYTTAIKIAKYVQNENVKRREGGNLIDTLDEIADCFEHIGKQYSEEYKKLYRYTYYVADFFKISKGLDFIKRYYEENFESEKQWY